MPSFPIDLVPPQHAIYQLEVTLEINGKVIPVVDAVIEFVLNQIPIARIQVPSGITLPAVDNNKLLTPDDLTGKVEATVRCVGYGKPHPTGVEARPTGDDDLILFSGYVLSSNVAFSTSGTSTTLVLVSWLYDLDNSSFASGDFDKTTPNDWFGEELVMLQVPDSTSAVRLAGGIPLEASKIPDADWWNDIIKPGFIYKASQPLKKFTNEPPSNNAAALSAIDKISGTLLLNDIAKASLKSTEAISRAINNRLGAMILTGQGGSSGFEKLINILSYFGAALAPTAGNAQVIAYSHLGAANKYIKDNECDFGSSSPNIAVLPVGAIMYGAASTSALANSTTAEIINSTFVGQFVPNLQGIEGGPFVVFPVPDYLAQIQISPIPNGAFKSKVGITSIGGTPTTPATPGPANSVESLKPFANELAKFHYFNKLYANKTLDVLCGYRTDIVPGMIVDITRSTASASGSNVSGLGPTWQKRGVVEAVTLVLSASGTRINTQLRLRHVMEQQDIELFAEYLGQATSTGLFNFEAPEGPLDE